MSCRDWMGSTYRSIFENPFCGLNGLVVCIADCYPKGAGFDSWVMLGIFPLRKRGLRSLVWQTNLGKEANLSRNPEREGPNSARLLRQYLLFYIAVVDGTRYFNRSVHIWHIQNYRSTQESWISDLSDMRKDRCQKRKYTRPFYESIRICMIMGIMVVDEMDPGTLRHRGKRRSRPETILTVDKLLLTSEDAVAQVIKMCNNISNPHTPKDIARKFDISWIKVLKNSWKKSVMTIGIILCTFEFFNLPLQTNRARSSPPK
jgi:hypothetical protein